MVQFTVSDTTAPQFQPAKLAACFHTATRFEFQVSRPSRPLQTRALYRGASEERPIPPPAGFASITFNRSYKDSKKAIRELFDEVDSDKSGLVTKENLRAFAEKRSLPSAYGEDFLKAFDTGSRGITFDEFLSFVNHKETALRNSFNKIDVNKDGVITVEDLENAVDKIELGCNQKHKKRFPWQREHLCTKLHRVKRSQVVPMLQATVSGEQDPCPNKSATLKARGPRDHVMDYNRFRSFFLLLPDNALLFDYWMDASCIKFRGCDVGGTVQVSNKQTRGQSSAASAAQHLIAGGVAGAVSRTATAPLETLRLRLMLGAAAGGAPAASKSVGSEMRVLWSEARGTKGGALFAGNGANVVRSAPQKAIDFFAFAAYKSGLKTLLGAPDPGGQVRWYQRDSVQVLAAGACAGATSSIVLYPLEVARSRLTTCRQGTYKGILDCLACIRRAEGGRSLYSGLGMSVLGILPEAAIAYGCFDLLKDSYARLAQIPKNEVGAAPAMWCGMISAFTGQAVAYPFEALARRMQVSTTRGAALQLAQEVIRKEGLGSLYRGIVPASIRVMPMAAVSFGVYEYMSHFVASLPLGH